MGSQQSHGQRAVKPVCVCKRWCATGGGASLRRVTVDACFQVRTARWSSSSCSASCGPSTPRRRPPVVGRGGRRRPTWVVLTAEAGVGGRDRLLRALDAAMRISSQPNPAGRVRPCASPPHGDSPRGSTDKVRHPRLHTHTHTHTHLTTFCPGLPG